MQKLILIIFIPFFTVSVNAQEYFNKHFEFDNINVADGGMNILELDDGYLVNGVSGDSLNISWWRWGLAKFNHSGELLWGKSWGDTISRRYFATHGSLFNLNGDTYALGGIESYLPEGTHVEVALIKFDNNFDTVWVSRFGRGQAPQDSSYILRDITTSGDGFVITGTVVIDYGETHQPFLLFLDSVGNYENIVYYPDSDYFYQAQTITRTNDGGFAIGAYKLWVVSGGHKGRAYIIKTDSIGNHEWELNLGGDYINGPALVCNSTDSSIVAASKFDTDSVFYNENRSNIRLTKVDYNGDIIWDKYYTQGKLYSGVSGISNDNDDGFLISGIIGETIYDVEPDAMSYLLKINNTGDSIWYRQYSIFNGKMSRNTLYHSIPTSDDGYAAIGTATPHPPDEGTKDAWIIKVDSMGCINFDDCWVGIKEDRAIEQLQELSIKVYPNPASNYFTIDIVQKDSNNNELVCEIFDLYGRRVEIIILQEGKTRISTFDWNNGLYLIKISSRGILFGSKKVLIK